MAAQKKTKPKISIIYTHGIGNQNKDTMLKDFHGEVEEFIKVDNLRKIAEVRSDTFYWRDKVQFNKNWKSFAGWLFRALPIIFLLLPLGGEEIYSKRSYSQLRLSFYISSNFIILSFLVSLFYYFKETFFVLFFVLVAYAAIKFMKPEDESNIINHVRMASATANSIDDIIKSYTSLVRRKRKSDRIFIISHSQGSFITYEMLKNLDESIQERITWISVGSGLKPLKILRGLQGSVDRNFRIKLSFLSTTPIILALLFSVWFTYLQNGADLIVFGFTMASSFLLPSYFVIFDNYQSLFISNFRENWNLPSILVLIVYISAMIVLCAVIINKLNKDSSLYKPVADIEKIEWIEMKSRFDFVSGFPFPLLPERVKKQTILIPVYSSRIFDHIRYFNANSSGPFAIFRIISSWLSMDKPEYEARLYQRELARTRSFFNILLFFWVCYYLSKFYFPANLRDTATLTGVVETLFNVAFYVMLFKVINHYRTVNLNKKIKTALEEGDALYFGEQSQMNNSISYFFYRIILVFSIVSTSLAFAFTEHISNIQIQDINNEGQVRAVSEFKMGVDMFIPNLYFIHGQIMLSGILGVVTIILCILRQSGFRIRQWVFISIFMFFAIMFLITTFSASLYSAVDVKTTIFIVSYLVIFLIYSLVSSQKIN